MYKISITFILFGYWLITLQAGAQVKTDFLITKNESLTKFESNFICQLNYVQKINSETGLKKYSDKTKLCEENNVIVDSGYLNEFKRCNNIKYTVGSYSIVYKKWYVFDLYLGICEDPESLLALGDFALLDLRDCQGSLIDRLVIQKTNLFKPDTISNYFCTTENGEVKLLQTWKNKKVFERIEKIPNQNERLREELYPTLPRSCYRILTYKIDSITGKFILQPQIETGKLLKEYQDISFDKDNPLYKYR